MPLAFDITSDIKHASRRRKAELLIYRGSLECLSSAGLVSVGGIGRGCSVLFLKVSSRYYIF